MSRREARLLRLCQQKRYRMKKGSVSTLIILGSTWRSTLKPLVFVTSPLPLKFPPLAPAASPKNADT
jgi:hypothetical protein